MAYIHEKKNVFTRVDFHACRLPTWLAFCGWCRALRHAQRSRIHSPEGHTITSDATLLNCTHNDSKSTTNCSTGSKIYCRNLFPQPEVVEILLSGSVVS